MKTAFIITAVRSGEQVMVDIREMAVLAHCTRGCCVTVATEDGVSEMSDNDMTEEEFVRVVTAPLAVQWLRKQDELGFVLESAIEVDKFLGWAYGGINLVDWSQLTDGESYA